MSSGVNEWKQQGKLYVWRYARAGRSRRGWHFSADRLGCISLLDLLDRLRGIDGLYRTWQLTGLKREAWRAPNYGPPKSEQFKRLRVAFKQDAEALSLTPDGEILMLSVGPASIDRLYAGFTSLSIGEGDFGIAPEATGKEPPWMFWWIVPDRIEKKNK